MFENHPRETSRRGHQDLLHTLILLGAVPLLFFAALQLVEKSADVLKEPDDVRPQPDAKPAFDLDVVQKKANSLFHPAAENNPPPGAAWLNEVAELEQRVASFRSLSNLSPKRIGSVQDRLVLIRQHIEQSVETLPKIVRNDHPLFMALRRLSDEIDGVMRPVPSLLSELNWKEASAAFEAKQTKMHTENVAREFERLTAPLKEPHRVELDPVLKELRTTLEKIQSLRDQELILQSKTDRELARQARLLAFEPVRAEALQLLAPLIALDYMQPGESARSWVQTAEKKPVSWRALERLGALDSSLNGLETLSLIGAQSFRSHDARRPLGSFPVPENAKLVLPRHIETTKRAQQLLKDHHQILIEEGLLSP